ncbi:MAG: hypothetical protein ACRC1G_17875 [Bradyrhizobium sp.]|nr:hypothetical protein [Bradyrhizobium sp.]
MRDKYAGAEQTHHNCCNLNHDTHPRAQPALNSNEAIDADLFQDDFAELRKWFRR